MPLLFLLSVKVIKDPAVATFAAFGSFAMLLLVDFQGRMWDRLRNQAALAVSCGAMITLATLVSQTTWLAAVTMGVVGFGVLFAGVASSILVGATQALLLSFILPVSLAAPASAIPNRLAGWGLAAGCSLLAIALLWPAPARDPVRTGAIAACRALAARLKAEIGLVSGDPDAGPTYEQAAAASDAAVEALHATFFATPFRPTGLSTSARAVVRLVDELRWLNAIVLMMPAEPHGDPQVRAVKAAAAAVLDDAAELLERPTGAPSALRAGSAALHAALEELERSTTTALPDGHAAASREQAHRVVS